MHGRLGILRTGENEERAFTWRKDLQDADLKEDKGIENGNCSKKMEFLIFPLLRSNSEARHRALHVNPISGHEAFIIVPDSALWLFCCLSVS